MRKFLIAAFLLALALCAWSQAPPEPAAPPVLPVETLAAPAGTAAPSPPWVIELGTGHIWTGAGSYAYSLDRAEWQVKLSGRYMFSPHLGAGIGVTNDGATITEWFHKHAFTSLEPVQDSYRYTATDLLFVYVINPEDKAKIVIKAGGTWYQSNGLGKAGETVGAALEYAFDPRWFLSVGLTFRHVQDFLVPVANVCETGIGVGFRF